MAVAPAEVTSCIVKDWFTETINAFVGTYTVKEAAPLIVPVIAVATASK